ncbi:MAG: hypothetical protein EAZ53_03435, partial [Bacteroidetes bacterium]
LKQSTLNKTGFEDSKLSEEDWKEALAICNKNINYATVYSDIPKATAGTQTAVNEILAYLLKKLKNAGTSQNASFPITQNLGTSFPTLTKPSTAPSASNQIVDYAGLSASDKQKLQSYLQNNSNSKVYITSEVNKTKSSTEANATSVYDNLKSQFDTKSALGTSDVAIWMHFNATEKNAYYKIIYKNNYFLPQSGQSLSLEKLLPCVERTQQKAIDNKYNFLNTTWDAISGGIIALSETGKEFKSIVLNYKIPEKYWKPENAPIVPQAAGFLDGGIQTGKGIYVCAEMALEYVINTPTHLYNLEQSLIFMATDPIGYWKSAKAEIKASKEVIVKIETSIVKWNDRLEGAEGNQISAYEGGKLLFEVASAIVTLPLEGATQAKNADEFTNAIEEVNKIAKKNVQGAGNFLDDIYNVQKNIINQWKNNIATATNIRKGNFGEMASDAFLAEKNFQPLHTRLQNIDAPTRQGIDGVFKKDNDYFIVEAKYSGTATLSTLSNGTKQMSDAWIRGNNRLIDAVGEIRAQEIIDGGYKRLLAEIAPDGTVIYKELDASANVIGTFTP